MGHKSNPIILRRGLDKWGGDSIWYGTGAIYHKQLKEDYESNDCSLPENR